jgi:hypothetical protein
VLLRPGDRVGSLEVVGAPGHTPGHVAFLDTRDRTLIAGDVFTTLGGTRSSTSTRLARCGRSSRNCSPSATVPRCAIRTGPRRARSSAPIAPSPEAARSAATGRSR